MQVRQVERGECESLHQSAGWYAIELAGGDIIEASVRLRGQDGRIEHYAWNVPDAGGRDEFLDFVSKGYVHVRSMIERDIELVERNEKDEHVCQGWYSVQSSDGTMHAKVMQNGDDIREYSWKVPEEAG